MNKNIKINLVFISIKVKYFNNYLRDPNRPQPFPQSRPAPNL